MTNRKADAGKPASGRRMLRDAWYMADWTPELDAEGLNKRTILGEPVVLYRGGDGRWVALEDMCCHRLVPLSLGRREGCALRCMYHGLKFGPDGRCIEIPGQDVVPPAVRVRSYPVVQSRGAVWIWTGDPERADPAAIPPIAPRDDPDHVFVWGSVPVDSNATLIWDNLLDLTHIPFAHANSFAEGDMEAISAMIAAETQNLVMEPLPDGVRSWRWHLAKPSYRFLGGHKADEFVNGDFVAPGALIISTRCYPVGTGRQKEMPPADLAPDMMRCACQVVVPVDENSSRIYFHLGIRHGPDSTREHLAGLMEKVLAEDAHFIEAQYAMMQRRPDRRPMDLAMDRAGVKFRAVMRRLAEAEDAPRSAAHQEPEREPAG